MFNYWKSMKHCLNSKSYASINLINPATGTYYPGAEYFLARGIAKSKLTPYLVYSPEPFLGDVNNCCAVMLNLNPGSGMCPSGSADFNLQHINSTDPNGRALQNTHNVVRDITEFKPYLNDTARNNIDYYRGPHICPGSIWWRGSWKGGSISGGRVDYLDRWYEIYYGTNIVCSSNSSNPTANSHTAFVNNIRPLALEICPWHSKQFALSHIFTSKDLKALDNGTPLSTNGQILVNVIIERVIDPALKATRSRKDTLPFVIAVGKPFVTLSKAVGLTVMQTWDESSGIPLWPVSDGRNVKRTYTLYRKNIDGQYYYLLVTWSPGSNHAPHKDFRSVEEQVIKPYIHKQI